MLGKITTVGNLYRMIGYQNQDLVFAQNFTYDLTALNSTQPYNFNNVSLPPMPTPGAITPDGTPERVTRFMVNLSYYLNKTNITNPNNSFHMCGDLIIRVYNNDS